MDTAPMIKSDKILTSKQDIIDYLGVTDKKFATMVELRLVSAVCLRGRWYAHTDNLDFQFKRATSIMAEVGAQEDPNNDE